MQFMANWTGLVNTGKVFDDLERPSPMGTLFDNTTLRGTWINIQDTKEVSDKFNRIVNNVTAALPHGGIFSAAQLPTNDMIGQSNLKVCEIDLCCYQSSKLYRAEANSTLKPALSYPLSMFYVRKLVMRNLNQFYTKNGLIGR